MNDYHFFAPLHEQERAEAKREAISEELYHDHQDAMTISDTIARHPDGSEDVVQIVADALAEGTPEAWAQAKLLCEALLERAIEKQIDERMAQ